MKVLLIITRVQSKEPDDFFTAWGIDGRGPWYFNGNGFPCNASSSENWAVVIVEGSAPELENRVGKAVGNRNRSDACVLVHPGGGLELPSWLNLPSYQWLKGGYAGVHEFSTVSSSGAATRKTLLELGQYTCGRAPKYFTSLLNVILEKCKESPSLEEFLREFNASPQKRKEAGLPEHPPPVKPANPLATIVHDVVSLVDAVLLDLQTAQQDPQSWTREVRQAAARNLEVAWARLTVLVDPQQQPQDQVLQEAKEWARRRGLLTEGGSEAGRTGVVTESCLTTCPFHQSLCQQITEAESFVIEVQKKDIDAQDTYSRLKDWVDKLLDILKPLGEKSGGGSAG